VQGVALALACLLSYWLTSDALARAHSLSFARFSKGDVGRRPQG
jgi:hypothetical protein